MQTREKQKIQVLKWWRTAEDYIGYDTPTFQQLEQYTSLKTGKATSTTT